MLARARSAAALALDTPASLNLIVAGALASCWVEAVSAAFLLASVAFA